MMLAGECAVGAADLRGGAAAVEAERGVMVGFNALQSPSLTGGCGGVTLIAPGRWFFPDGEQLGLLEQPAEILFARLVQRAFLVAEVGHGFICHGEPFQLHDADIFLARFPNLTLAEFHGMR